jgi:CubicO group peptidase (beta-lactamase class C family)
MPESALAKFIQNFLPKGRSSRPPVSMTKLSSLLEVAAKKFHVPGIAVGILYEGNEFFASYGVTNVDQPQPVGKDTLFMVASVTKTFTASAIMHLVSIGKVHLHDPIKDYLPELFLDENGAFESITVLQLLNHTSGLEWRLDFDTGEGVEALAKYVELIKATKPSSPAGASASYSQVGYNLLGRILEKVTGQTYEQAIESILFQPLGLSNSFFDLPGIQSRQHASGHNEDDQRKLVIAKQLKYSRNENPGGGLATSASDLIRWARFHLGDPTVANGVQVLPLKEIEKMQIATTKLHGSSLGDAIGIGWFLRKIAGMQLVTHSGSGNGQFSELLLVPERHFAVVALCNGGPNGIQFNQAVLQWTMSNYLGLVERPPRPLQFDAALSQEVSGTYENEIQVVKILVNGKKLTISAGIKPEVRAATDKELPADYPSAAFFFFTPGQDDFYVSGGGMRGQRGAFTRNGNGMVDGVNIGGRTFKKVPSATKQA